uniref:Uncharacterized protein n=1 Tax=Anguilla anguilla TaxID=7936 RepID=A0A0E9PHI7_ANGAN
MSAKFISLHTRWSCFSPDCSSVQGANKFLVSTGKD